MADNGCLERWRGRRIFGCAQRALPTWRTRRLRLFTPIEFAMVAKMFVAIRKRLLASALAALLPCAAAYAAPENYSVMTVDAKTTVGEFKPLRGVSGAPDMSFVTLSAEGPGRGRKALDVSAGYRDIAVTEVRTHDSMGAGDLDRTDGPLAPLRGPPVGDRGGSRDLLLFPDLSADPNNPASYNFGPTDKLVEGIRAINADVIFRLGRGSGTTAEPPNESKDLAKYAEIIRHVVLHYNKGWDNGYQNAVKYWEVWNEPDLGQIWWRGTPEEYYKLYAAAAKAVKAADAKTLVGGPTIALVNEKTPYREGFLPR
jgi:xylan 1,4-beta-xylosidase